MELNLRQSDATSTSPCAQCGQEFEKPLMAELQSGNTIQEYCACPRCLSKVGEIEQEGKIENMPIESNEFPAEEAPRIEITKIEETPGCPYQMGYLRKRPKGTPIPEGCLTCTKMIECI